MPRPGQSRINRMRLMNNPSRVARRKKARKHNKLANKMLAVFRALHTNGGQSHGPETDTTSQHHTEEK